MLPIFWQWDGLIGREQVVFPAIVTWIIAKKLTVPSNEIRWIWHKTGKVRNSPENMCSRGHSILCTRSQNNVREHNFCMLAVSKITPTMPTFCMLECSASCLSGGTGAADTRLTNHVLGVGTASVSAVHHSSGTCAIFSVMSGNGIAIRGVGPRTEVFVFCIMATSSRRIWFLNTREREGLTDGRTDHLEVTC